ncbi:hypothetical protein [Domibacillus aminovorans]|uniref:Uncharacterized protein n=1 Tax=Domibacillus aminovorans TaxID=29332 RepID=A0A177LC16_9BACI|nr:hypothetical protein [Domibacillus aminovorans]OAH62812.1 hypothetical protein AWH49_09110 [Domibacillus aminovorans]
MEGLIFVIIAGLISMFFNKGKNKDEQKTARKKVEQQAKSVAKQADQKAMEASVQNSISTPAPVQKPVQKRETRQSRPIKPVSQPVKGVEKWSEQDFLKGIILSEVLGPPKSKRKK